MKVLSIDDDPAQNEILRLFCSRIEYPRVSFASAESLSEALALIERENFDLVISDLRLPDGSGLEVLRASKALNPLVPVVVMTAHEDAREAVGALKGGADDYLLKPTSREDIERLVLRLHEKASLRSEAFLPPGDGPAPVPASSGIIYRSEAMAGILSLAARSADSNATVLITGESGTGKELIARFIHERGPRRGGKFVAVNVSALPESLAEAELFGHRKGSFTGASSDRAGRFEEADGGTLFLDEIGEIPPALQVKLLRAIQFGEVERIGENAGRRLDVRIIAATNQDLAALVAAGRFREDLFYRVNVIGIALPPLRVRKEDIPPLVESFVESYGRRNGREIRGISKEAMNRLMRHDFPGNVRELENLIERAVVLARGELILERDLPSPLGSPGAAPERGPGGYEEAMRGFETALLREALERAGWNQSRAARELGIGERRLRSRMQRLGLAEKGST